MTKKSEKKQNIENYSKFAVFYSKKFSDLGAKVREKDIDKAFSYVTKPNPKTVEIGCGNGRDAKEIMEHTNDYLGTDLSEGMLELAKQNAPGVNFQLADLEEYSFPSGVDVVFSFASLIHSDKSSLKKVLERVYKALDLGGVFLISLKYGDYHKETLDRDGVGMPRTYYFYTPEEIKELLPNGFEIVYEDIQDFNNQKWFTIILRKIF